MASPVSRPVVAMDVRMAWNSGIGRYIREVAPRVRELLPECGWRWVGIAPEEWMRLDHPQTEFVEWSLPIYSFKEHIMAPRVFRDVAVRWIPHYNLTPGETGSRVIVTLHDVLPLRFASGWREKIRASVCRRYLRRIGRDATMIFTDSQFTADELAAVGNISDNRVQVILLGCDYSAKIKGSTAQPSSFASRPVRPYFLFVGNIKPHKNLRALLTAWSQVAGTIPEDLILIGRRDGFFTGDVVAGRLAKSLGNRVIFAGQVSDSQLQDLMVRATALVQPSLYEGFGLPVLEAMAAGCPVISSRAASLPEVGGDCVLYFDPHDVADLGGKLVRMSNDEALRIRMRERGVERAREFTWERTAELTARGVRQILESV